MDIKQYLTAIDEADRQHSPSQRASFADVLVDEIRDIFGCDDKRLCEVLQAERDGRLVVLPCKVGDVAFITHNDGFIIVRNPKFAINRNGLWIETRYGNYSEKDFGKKVYFDEDEAKAAVEWEGVTNDI